MTTKVQANIRVHELMFFPEKDGTSAKMIIKGYSIGPDAFYNTVEVWGKEAERMNQYLKKNSQIDVSGILATRKVEPEGKKPFYVTYIKTRSPIHFLSGTKNDLERVELKPVDSFSCLPELKSYVASVVEPYGFMLPPAAGLDYLIARIGQSDKSMELAPIMDWLGSLHENVASIPATAPELKS